MVVATYTINDTRKQVVVFAGPYFVAQQDIMVKADDDTIKGVDDLNGKKVCTAQGSTSLKNLEEQAPDADLSITFDTYFKCADALRDGRVEAVSTDNVILLGLVDASEGEFKLVGKTFTEEPYGIGLKKDDQAFRDFLNDRLEEIYESGEWAEAYERTLGKLGLSTPEPPPVNRYPSTGTATSTSTYPAWTTRCAAATCSTSTTATRRSPTARTSSGWRSRGTAHRPRFSTTIATGTWTCTC